MPDDKILAIMLQLKLIRGEIEQAEFYIKKLTKELEEEIKNGLH